MSEVNQALQRIARGTGIVFAGTVISMFLGFLSRAIIARYFSTGEYGVFNLALTILSIALVVATLGFPNALPREVAFYKEKEPSRLEKLIPTALIIVTLNSLAIMVLLILSSEFIAQIFNEARLDYALEIVVISLPFSAVIGVIISITQGFGRVREKVYFQNVIYPTIWLVLVLFLYVFALSFSLLFFTYVLAQGVTCILLCLEVFRTRLFELRFSFDLKLGKELIVFSIPLMLTGILWFFMGWADTLMLGYYKTSESVGLYNAATLLARFLPILLTSAEFVYIPIASSLYARNEIAMIRKTYSILTKWIFLLTLPLSSVIFLFPENVILYVFGSKYIKASSALQILSLGFMFHISLGLNGGTLIAIKKSNFLVMSNLISTVFNVMINAILIPIYGIEGAAVATVISYSIANLLNSFKLYKDTKIHPFNFGYIKCLVIYSLLLLGIRRSSLVNLVTSNILDMMLFLFIFLGAYLILVFFSRGISKEDFDLLLMIAEQLGTNPKITGIFRKFIR
ncbi:flippase [Thermococcus alcaliphilus]|uniref:flippase n=1 Tax=Thermococcus alcaliphilus TaxID=139207 RepID=UPI002090F555|nr:flippase [Thermococcus alcaliphilus]MCO6042260.1 flippase [Thermococcus alcaliphilus]